MSDFQVAYGGMVRMGSGSRGDMQRARQILVHGSTLFFLLILSVYRLLCSHSLEHEECVSMIWSERSLQSVRFHNRWGSCIKNYRTGLFCPCFKFYWWMWINANHNLPHQLMLFRRSGGAVCSTTGRRYVVWSRGPGRVSSSQSFDAVDLQRIYICSKTECICSTHILQAYTMLFWMIGSVSSWLMGAEQQSRGIHWYITISKIDECWSWRGVDE